METNQAYNKKTKNRAAITKLENLAIKMPLRSLAKLTNN